MRWPSGVTATPRGSPFVLSEPRYEPADVNWTMRSLPESATEIVPPASMVSADGLCSWPAPLPGEPIERAGSPVARCQGVLHQTGDRFVRLDTHTGEDILGLIRELHARLGSTIVIVTHDMHVAESCSRTIALRDGAIVQDIARAQMRPVARTGVSA